MPPVIIVIPNRAEGPVNLPSRIGPAHQRLLRALAERASIVVLLGATGDSVADQPSASLARQLAPGRPEPVLPDGGVVTATHVVGSRQRRQRGAAGACGGDHGPTSRRHPPGTDGRGAQRARPLPPLLHGVVRPGGDPDQRPRRPDVERHRGRARPSWARWLCPTTSGGATRWWPGWPARPSASRRVRPTTVPATRWDELSRRAGVTAGSEAWFDHLDRRSSKLQA